MHITKDFKSQLDRSKLLENTDWAALSELSRKKGIKKGAGYSRTTFKSIVENSCTCTEEVYSMILEYYANKKNLLEMQNVILK